MTREKDDDLLSPMRSSIEIVYEEPMVEGTFLVGGIPTPYGCANLTFLEVFQSQNVREEDFIELEIVNKET